ncbi:MAG: universal stress protein [Candidatus Sericytochromatia bacterium]
MLTHILFPTDFSQASETAFRQVLELALPFRARVTLLHVYDILGPWLDQAYKVVDPKYFEKVESELQESALQKLEILRKQLSDAKVSAEILCRRGHAGQQIVELAGSLDCNLIIMGSRGLGTVGSYLLGSTSNYVLHHSLIPVMVIPSVTAPLQIVF